MQLSFTPKTTIEEFAAKIYFLLVENFSHTYFVGGMVRDLILKKTIADIDIATEALPDEVIKVLETAGVLYDATYQNFGVIKAMGNGCIIEIATLRTERYRASRYPMVSFINDPAQDSWRRDFTVNSLYLSAKNNNILDFHKAEKDFKQKIIRFVGDPEQRISEDPLRIIRALRFALNLNFSIEENSLLDIKKKFNLVKTLQKNKINSEIEKVHSENNKIILLSILKKPKTLDTYFNTI